MTWQRFSANYVFRRFPTTRNTTRSARKIVIVATKMVIGHLLTSMTVGEVFVLIAVDTDQRQ